MNLLSRVWELADSYEGGVQHIAATSMNPNPCTTLSKVRKLNCRAPSWLLALAAFQRRSCWTFAVGDPGVFQTLPRDPGVFKHFHAEVSIDVFVAAGFQRPYLPRPGPAKPLYLTGPCLEAHAFHPNPSAGHMVPKLPNHFM